MKVRIVSPESLWNNTRAFLFAKQTYKERAGFFIAGISRSPSSVTLLPNKYIPILEKDLLSERRLGFEIHPRKVIELVNTSYARGLALIEVHSHPWIGKAQMSSLDKKGIKSMVDYLAPEFPEAPYAALVFTYDSFKSETWLGKQKNTTVEMKSVGRKTVFLNRRDKIKIDERRFDRQLLFLGRKGQKQISLFKVGIVGLGGTGSHVAQQLAYLGVRDFILVDHDKIEKTNLNRLIGASVKDIGKYKVEISKRLIRSVAPDAKVITAPSLIFSKESTHLIKDVDFIFGCVDADGARLVLNNISVAYLIPYLDVGSDINLTKDGKIDSIGGTIFFVFPGGPCLLCSSTEIDQNEVRNDLSSQEELEKRRAQGYANGKITSPAVISVNGAIASQAVTEFMFYAAGIPSQIKIIHDLYGKILGKPTVVKKDGCVHCVGEFGKGDKSAIEQYGRYKI